MILHLNVSLLNVSQDYKPRHIPSVHGKKKQEMLVLLEKHFYLCLMSPMPAFIKKGTPSQRALSMYRAAAKNVGVREF